MTNESILPTGGRSREEIARIEVGQTTVSPSVARGLVAFFLTTIAVVPLIEALGARSTADGSSTTVWARLADIPAQMAVAVQRSATSGRDSLWNRIVAANRAALGGLAAFEHALEDESVVGHGLRPPAQEILSGWVGAGNERVYVGRDGWLFYRPDVEYLTGPGFLDASVLRRRSMAVSEWTALPHPDPRPAILQFHQQLAAEGISLIVMPTPGKPAIHPEKLAASLGDYHGPVHNPSYITLIEELHRSGVLVFDPSPILSQSRQSGPQYVATDTHWRPEAMELVAERLAAFVNQHLTLSAAPIDYRTEDREVTNAGDTVVMLDLPAGQRLYPRERALVRRVLEADGTAWRPDRTADVLVLGDSFSNIYSLASMGWGESAGLIEQISYALARPMDRIVQNDDGAFATRAMLARAGRERRAGKRVVIWQFAARELAFGDWQLIDAGR